MQNPELEDNGTHCPWTDRKNYVNVFLIPDEPWNIPAVWADAYFRSSRLIVEGVVKNALFPRIEGIAGLYLFRHYLELQLKYIIFHANWLKDSRTNAEKAEIEDVKKTHSLSWLWARVKADCPSKLGDEGWASFDIAFVDACVAEFDAVDPHPGERFRYCGKKFGVNAQEAGKPAIINHLHIDFVVLLDSMQHVRDVLHAIDVYLYETHGQNEDWEEILSSF